LRLISLTCVASCLASTLQASDLDEFKVKRQAVYKFTQKPKVSRDGGADDFQLRWG